MWLSRLKRLWLGNGKKLRATARLRPLAPSRRRLGLEELEDRVVPSLSPLTWTAIGPAPVNNGDVPGGGPVSGRVTGVATDPRDAKTIFIASAGGGVWKTTNGGNNWSPQTDNVIDASGDPIPQFMGAIAETRDVAGNEVIYAGTGEANNAYDSYYGVGVLVSKDGGETWTLQNDGGVFTGQTVSKIAIDPSDRTGGTAYVAIANFGGNKPNAHPNTGIWKTTDFGVNWKNATATLPNSPTFNSWSDVVIDPRMPSTLYAAEGTYTNTNGFATGNGVYKSTDGGGHWSLLNGPGTFNGQQDGRIALALFNNGTSQELFVSIANPFTLTSGMLNPVGGQLFKMLKSTDGGGSFTDLTATTTPPPNYMGATDANGNNQGQGWYDTTLAVSPTNPSFVYAGGSDNGGSPGAIESLDGGTTWIPITVDSAGNGPHTDDHATAFDKNGNLIDGNDGGVWHLNLTTQRWSDLNTNLQITQFTGIALDPSNPDIAYGGSQDNGTDKLIGTLGWGEIWNGDGGITRVDPTLLGVVYQEQRRISLQVSTNTGNTFNLITAGIRAYNFIGTTNPIVNIYAPYVLDSSGDVLYGTDFLNLSTNKGTGWTQIGTPTMNNFNPNDTPIDSIAVAPSNKDVVYVSSGGGLRDGNGNPIAERMFVTKNAITGGANAKWTEIDLPGLPTGVGAGARNSIAVDPTHPGTAYAVVNAFTGGALHVFRTTNFGLNNSWFDISAGLPDTPVNAVALGPGGSTVYVGTDMGVYLTSNGGTTWTRFSAGLPNAQVVELTTAGTTLAAGTHGRGLFEIKIPLLVTTLSDAPGHTGESLRDAIALANQDAALGLSDTITFAPGLSGTITLTQGLLELTPGFGGGTITIDGGNQVILSQSGPMGVFQIDHGAQAVLDGLTIKNGQANGGGILNHGKLTLNNSALSGNSAGIAGGGIFNDGTLTVSNCTFDHNTSQDGGALFNVSGTATITNSTFALNSADNGSAMFIAGGSVDIADCTVSGNSLLAPTNLGNIVNFGALTIHNSIVTLNLTSNGNNGISQDISGGFTDLGHNLLGPELQTANSPATDKFAYLPGTLSLGFYGGPTETMPVLPGSPANGAGAFVSVGGGPLIFTDQRGLTLVGLGSVDIGACQSQPDNLLVTTNSDSPGHEGLSLRDAANLAQALAGATGTPQQITIPSNLTAITLLTPISVTTGNITITSQGTITISGNHVSKLLQTGGNAKVSIGSGTRVDTRITFAAAEPPFGAISNAANLTLTNCNFFDNVATINGGAIDNTGTLAVANCLFSGNSAGTDGGAIDNEGGVVTVADSTFYDNSAGLHGGGIANTQGGTLTMVRSTIIQNSAPNGPDIWNDGTLTLTRSTINGYGGPGTGSVIIDDSGDTANATYTITASTVQINSAPPITYTGAASLTVIGGSGTDIFNVLGTTAATPAAIITGAGRNTINVTPTSQDLSNIQGSLTVQGLAMATLIVNDQNGAAAANSPPFNTYTVTNAIIQTARSALISYSGLDGVTLNGDSLNDVCNVQSTAAGTPVILNTGNGNNSVNVGDAGNTLHGIQGVLRVNGQGGNTSITFNSQGAAVGTTSQGATWYSDHVVFSTDGPTPETIYFSKVQLLTENATVTPSWGDLLYYSVPSLHLTLNSAYGSSVLFPLVAAGQTQVITLSGLDSGTISNGPGTVTFNGYYLLYAEGTGTTVYKPLPGANQIAAYVDHASQGNGIGVLDLSALTAGVTVNLPPHVLQPGVGNVPGLIQNFTGINTIIGTSGTDTLVGADVANTWTINGRDKGQVGGINFRGFENLQGGSAADTFQFTGVGGLDGGINGGGGVNTLDYSNCAGDIIVDLPLGYASRAHGGIANIQDVIGGGSNAILVGNGGNTLTGGSGRNLLIAGPTPSTLNGNAGEDILVGGTTAYDTNLAALSAIMAEWTRKDIAYAQRVGHLLSGGGKNGTTLLNPATFSTNGGHNTLPGGAGLDVFYGFRTLEATDYDPTIGEIFVNDATFGHTRIDTRNLSLPQVELDSTQLLTPGVTPYLTLTPGTHTLTDLFTANQIQFTVGIDGTVDYDPSLNSVLSGRGTTTLIVNGATVRVDATRLSLPTVSVNFNEFIENTNNPFTLNLLPGLVGLTDVFTANTVQFNVADDGTLSYDPSLQGVFTTAGPSTLTVHGAAVTVDATKLGATTPTLSVNLNEIIKQNNAAFTLDLLPGRAFLIDPQTNAAVRFNLANDGTISYDPTLQGILTGAGTMGTLGVNGVTLNVDATALSQQDTTFTLDGVASASTAPVQSFQVLPGGSNTFQAGSTSMSFSIDALDQLSFATIYDAIATGRGTNTLTLL